MALPAELFAGHAPRLRKLHLYTVYLPWDASLLRNLDELIIHHDPWVETLAKHAPSSERLLDILRSCPNLQTLILRGCLPFTHNIHPDTPPVPLHRLQRLDLRGSIGGVECILKHCALSLSCKLGVDIRGWVDELPRVTSALHPVSSATHAHPLSFMSMSMHRDSILIHAWCTLPMVTVWGHFSDPLSTPDIKISLILCDGNGTPNWTAESRAEIMRIGDLLHLEDIQAVALDSVVQSQLGITLFLTRTRLKYLIVHARAHDTFFTAPSMGMPGALLYEYPELKSIWVRQFDFGLQSDRRRPLFAEQLQLYLAQRSTAGMKVEIIVLDRCYGTSPELLEGLKRAASKVGFRAHYLSDPDHSDPELC
ncbi:hypothetical protein BC834DRAFT_886640 [Gloeopeniophorella convolvens]|nr:hypothetical protein BC834DRAFT_886640 [Gloeopeniophorella convolvens]